MGVAVHRTGVIVVYLVCRSAFVVLFFLLAVAARAASGTEYFVALDGADTNAGDSERPFRTIARGVLALTAGDTLVVRAGTYPESIIIARAGGAGAPITVQGLTGAILVNPQPGSSRSAIDIYAVSAHVVVRGFEITGGFAESVFVRAGAQDIELAQLDVHHNLAGIWIAGASRVAVRDTWVHHNARSGIRIFAGARDVQLTDVRTEYQDDGQGCAGDADGISVDETVVNLELVRVQSNYNSEDGLDVSAPNIQMREVEARANACSGVKLGGGGRLENLLITGSRIGLNISGGVEVTTTLINSTLLDNGIGVRALGTGSQITVQNCVVSGVGKALHVNGEVVLREHHNIFYRPDADSRLIVRMIAGAELLYSGADVNAGIWQIASGGQGNGTIAVDPQLDSSGRTLGPRGPAVDSGEAADCPVIDLAGATRPMGRAVDRGAFEYAPAAVSAVVSRVVVRDDGSGAGELRVRMNLTLPWDQPLDIRNETIRLTVRGSGGTVTTTEIGAASRPGSTAGYPRRVRFRRVGSERITVTVRQTADVVRVSLRAAGVNIAALQSDELWVDVVAGDVVVAAYAELRNTNGRLSLP